MFCVLLSYVCESVLPDSHWSIQVEGHLQQSINLASPLSSALSFRSIFIVPFRSYQHVRTLDSFLVCRLPFLSGNAHVIAAFNKNFGITTNQKWTLALSIFYVGYCACSFAAIDIFSNALCRFVRNTCE
jgi:hypothetical protein